MSLETAYVSTIAKRLESTDTTITAAAVPLSVTKGVVLMGEEDAKEWASFTGVSGLTLTGVTRGLDKDASSITDNASGDQPALTHVAGTPIRLVASHLDLVDADGDNTISGTNTYSSTTKAVQIIQNVTTTQRDSLVGVVNGAQIYNTTLGQMQWREGGAWVTNASGGSSPDGSETVSGGWEGATVAEQGVSAELGGSGPLVPMNKNLIKTSSGPGDENKIILAGSTGEIDEGFIPTLTNSRNTIPTGLIQMTFGSSAPTDWFLLNGDTVGNASSGATQASASNSAIFTHLWDNLANTQAPVSSGRGASAAADFAANKTITMPDARGRVLVMKKTGTFATMGDATIGAETHVITAAEMPAHTHTIDMGTGAGGGPQAQKGTNASVTQQTSSSAGSGTAHNNLQPSLTINYIIKT